MFSYYPSYLNSDVSHRSIHEDGISDNLYFDNGTLNTENIKQCLLKCEVMEGDISCHSFISNNTREDMKQLLLNPIAFLYLYFQFKVTF